MPPKYAPKPCDCCGEIFVPASSRSLRCSPECRRKKATEYQRQWRQTDAGTASEEQYRRSDDRKRVLQEYSRSPKNRANQKRYRERHPEESRERVRQCQQQRRQTEEVKAQERSYRRRPASKKKAARRSRERNRRLGSSLHHRRLLPLLLERDGHTCGICGKALPDDRDQIHVDHKIPVHLGGSDDPANLPSDPCRLQLGTDKSRLRGGGKAGRLTTIFLVCCA